MNNKNKDKEEVSIEEIDFLYLMCKGLSFINVNSTNARKLLNLRTRLEVEVNKLNELKQSTKKTLDISEDIEDIIEHKNFSKLEKIILDYLKLKIELPKNLFNFMTEKEFDAMLNKSNLTMDMAAYLQKYIKIK